MSQLLAPNTDKRPAHPAASGEAPADHNAAPQAEHPIDILMKEHELLLELAESLQQTARKLAAAANPAEISERLRQLARDLKAAENHYLREENSLFPALERHGVSEPPAVMWAEHDQVRGIKKRIYQVVGSGEGTIPKPLWQDLSRAADDLASLLPSHFLKENRILFPIALQVVTEQEWGEVSGQFADIGYWKVAPENAATRAGDTRPDLSDGTVTFGSGTLPLSSLEAILNTLPVELTFVDHEDRVRYFNQTPHRIFVRSTGILGREVQKCHPQKSFHLVNRILDEFRAGQRDSADFWIQSEGRFFLIRFLAVRRNGEYLGCLEIAQDITEIRRLEGEKRLL